MVDQAEEGNRDTNVIRIVIAPVGGVEGGVVAEGQGGHGKAHGLLGGGNDAAVGEEAEAADAGLGALLAGHEVIGVEALVQLHHREHVQVGAVQLDAQPLKLVVVAADVVDGQLGAQEAMRAAVPEIVVGMSAVDVHEGVVQIKGGSVVVVVAVLVVDAEVEAQLGAGLLQSLHACGTACALVNGEGIGMEVVVALLAPAVQVEVGLLNALALQLGEHTARLREGTVVVVVLGVVGIVEVGGGVDVGGAARMHHGTADEVLYLGVFGDLFLQRHQLATLGDIGAVDLGDGVEVALGEEGVQDGAGVVHLTQGGDEVGLDLIAHHAVTAVVGGLHDSRVAAVTLADLTVHGDVGVALVEEAVLEGVAMLGGDDGALHTGQDGVALALGDVKAHAGREGQGGDLAHAVLGDDGLGSYHAGVGVDGDLGGDDEGVYLTLGVAEVLVHGADTLGNAGVVDGAFAVAVGEEQVGLVGQSQERLVAPGPGDVRAVQGDGQGTGLGDIVQSQLGGLHTVIHGGTSLSIGLVIIL